MSKVSLYMCKNFFWYNVDVSSTTEILCNIEGSGAFDCPSDQYCCKQSICNEFWNHDKNPDKRCCTEDERNKMSPPLDCVMDCYECCDESERQKIPIPKHCSYCRKCIEGKIYSAKFFNKQK